MTKKEIYNQLLEVYKKTAKEFDQWPNICFLPFQCQPENIDTAFDLYKNGKCLQNPELDDNSLVMCLGKLSKKQVSQEFVWAQDRYCKLVADKRKAEFYATEEGAMYKEMLESERAELLDKCKEVREQSLKVIEKTIKEMLGDRWCVSYFSVNSFRVALMNSEGKTIFGHDFTIYMESPYFEEKTPENTKIELNYGALGSFNVMEDVDRREFLRGMYMFSNAMDEVDNIRKYLFEVSRKLDYLHDAISEKDKALDNPPLVA